MATNDFVPVAPGPGANVASQATYLADPATSTGNVSGVAKSAIINKSLRQGTIMAAVLAQFIVDYTGQNAVDDGTTSTLLANLKSATKGRLIAVQVVTASGTYIPSSVVTSIEIEGVGGGGAGGGTVNPGAGASTAGGGGSSGAYAKKRITSGIASASVVIGAGGSGVVGGKGGDGTATSFGAVLTIPGGGGAPVAGAIAGAGVTGSVGTQATTPTGADVGFPGNAGMPGFLLTASNLITGAGANCNFGAGGSPIGAGGSGSSNGANASGYGSGGAGSYAIGSASSLKGGNGNSGILIIREYA